MLGQREYFMDYHLTQKGKMLWDQIHMLHWYAWELYLRYDYTCCSRMKAPHLPFSCEEFSIVSTTELDQNKE